MTGLQRAFNDLHTRLDRARSDGSQATGPASPGPPELDGLCAAFALSPFERDVLLLCAGVELNASVASLSAELEHELGLACPSFGAALRLLDGGHWSAVAPAAPLRRWRLVEPEQGEGPAAARLGIDERVLHHLLGADCLDERLAGFVEPLDAGTPLPESHAAAAERLAALWHGGPLAELCGGEPAARRDVAAAAAAAAGSAALLVRAGDVPASGPERDGLARLCEREAVLSGAVLVVELDEAEAAAGERAVRLAESVRATVALSAADPVRGARRTLARVELGPLAPEERLAVLTAAIGDADDGVADLERIAAHFALGAQALRAAAATARSRPDDVAGALWDACREEARPRLEDLAQRIEPAAGWDDLVLPAMQREVLRELAAQVRCRAEVYERWGFAARGSRGLGISALFSGPSGTGKTMATEVLARDLRLDLFRIDLSSVVSKYIGETEKNLRRVFDAAEAGGAVLLFDEADALFGKRTEVRDSHDRYANIEVSYLLQRMEAYRGLAVLTTNMRSALDPAFLRRIRFVVDFPFPEAAQREEIWARAFPAQTPTDGLRPEDLARLNVAGGTIRNIALNAAFLAADAGEPVRMAHLLTATRTEYGKLERALAHAEVARWD